ncbi:MAG: hypothetical protein M0D54_10475 [Hyphomonadaceae bacterium JAD_PAG50586_4]|nr:MAG: hypothetical protein M0D54_10475 [Hyphomonadaceae bacterium JAD_PAG50586_4]
MDGSEQDAKQRSFTSQEGPERIMAQSGPPLSALSGPSPRDKLADSYGSSLDWLLMLAEKPR